MERTRQVGHCKDPSPYKETPNAVPSSVDRVYRAGIGTTGRRSQHQESSIGTTLSSRPD